MNKRVSYILIFSFLIAGFNSTAQKRYISENELPASVRSYITTHFNNNKIIQSKEKKKDYGTYYKVKLDQRVKLEFDSHNKIKEIKSKSKKLPDSVIPSAILSYVKKNYPNNVILQWELEDNKQEIELDNKLELEFDMDGKFLRID